MSGQFSGSSSLPSPQLSRPLHTQPLSTHIPFEHFQSSGRHLRSTEQQTKRLQYHVYSPSSSLHSSFSSLSFTFAFIVFVFHRHFIISLCLRCYYHHHHCHNHHQLTAVSFVGNVVPKTVVVTVTEHIDRQAYPVVALELVEADAMSSMGCRT